MWQQLAPPDLRVLFPVRTQAAGVVITLPVRPVKPHHRTACVLVTRPAHAGKPCGKLSPGAARSTPGKKPARV
jgi:hypothetical protein